MREAILFVSGLGKAFPNGWEEDHCGDSSIWRENSGHTDRKSTMTPAMSYL